MTVRVLQAITHLHAGAAEYLYRLLAGLDRSRCEVVIARSVEGGTLEGRIGALGFPMVEMPWRRSAGVRGFAAGVQEARRLMRHGHFDVVVTHSSIAAAAVRLAAPFAGSPPVVHVAHGWACYALGPAYRLAAYRLAECALGSLTTCAVSPAQAMIDFGAEHRLFRPGTGVRLPFQLLPAESGAVAALPRAALGVPDDAELVVCAGRLAPQKGVSTLVSAWPEVAARRPKAWLCVVGDGPDREALHRSAAGMPRIAWAGWRSDVRACMAAADVVAVPSAYEPFGIVLLEAMAQAKPVVASRVGGITEILRDGVTGEAVPPGDPAALAASLAGLLGDPARARALGAAGRRRLETVFVGDAVARGHLRLYERLAQKARAISSEATGRV
jgi:glycosyltransferase involved in cell wall biosynthesis